MGWQGRIDPIIEVGLRGAAAGSMQWDVSNWDSAATWSGLEPTWVALDAWNLESVQTRRGRKNGVSRHAAGTGEVVLVWPEAAGKSTFRLTAPVRLGQEMRIRARPRDLDGTPYDIVPIFRGAVRDVVDGWEPNDSGKKEFRVTVRLTDRFADLAAVNLPEGALEGLGDFTDDRLLRILEKAEIDPFYARFAPGIVEHQSSNFARNLLDEAQVAVEGEVGEFYVDREGFYVLRPRHGSDPTDRETNVQLAWTNGADMATEGYPVAHPLDFGSGQNLDDVVNQVSMARAGGTAYTASDADSKLQYGLRTYQRMDLTCRYDADVTWAADWRLDQLKDRTQRIDALTGAVLPLADGADLVALLDVELGDKHFVHWDDGDRIVSGSLHVQGVSHRIDGDAWEVTADLWAYAGEGPVTEAIWGEAVWGSDRWQGG